MIDLYFWNTPNGYKPLIMLEELGCAYNIKTIDISNNEQFDPDFLKISPNNKIPAIVDTKPQNVEAPISVFESGAILIYLAEKYKKLFPQRKDVKFDVLQWVFWQVGSLGPMKGQAHHYWRFAKEDHPYSKKRYRDETVHLLGVLNRQIDSRKFICGDEYTIADIMSYPWISSLETLEIDLENFTNVKKWHDRLSERPAIRRAYESGEAAVTKKPAEEE